MQSLPPPPHSLTVGEGFQNPLGYLTASPLFTWKLPGAVERQAAYRIEARTAEASWDSGWVESDSSTFVPYRGPALSSRQRVEWRVRFRDGNRQESDWSKPAHFELGLLSAADWKAQWIRPSQPRDVEAEAAGWLRRTFSVDKPVTRARVYVTAHGLFELRLNDRRVSDDHFANGWTAYDKRLHTLAYDVTGHLQPGDNVLQATLGSGWFAGRLPFETKNVGPYGKYPELLLQLEITFDDGSSQTVATDEQCEGTNDGPIVSSSIYDGEIYDARKTVSGWQPVLANSDLGPAELTPKPFPPVRQTQTLAPQTITEPTPGRYVFDLGQNMVGWARIKVPVEKDQTVKVRFAEMLKPDGTLYTENYRTAKSTDTYTAAATGTIEWEPHFTFHGFRYAELSGLPQGVPPQKEWVTGVVLHSDLPTIGRFTCSHAKLNRLQSNISWGWRGNMLDIPTDCPQRDERCGWTGDAQVFCPTAMFNTDSIAFWKSWLTSVRDEQDDNGLIPDIIPRARSKWRSESPGWIDAAVFIPWDVYVRSGDVTVLSENFDMMARLVGWYRGKLVDGLLPNAKAFGDWLQPYSRSVATPEDAMGDRRGDTPAPLLAAAFYGRDLQILVEAARVLGRTEEADRYAAEAAALRAAFTNHFFTPDGRLQNATETQTGYVLAIAFDLIPADLKPKAGSHLVRLIRGAGTHLRTGFLGTPHLTVALDQTGHADVAAELLFQESYPSWFYPINQGATTMWERWNSYSHEHGFGDVKMNSFNHYAYGAIGQWMYERIAGLAPDPANPGYKHFFIRPLLIDQLDSARADLETPFGQASSGWVKQDRQLSLHVEVPPNTTATLLFPDGRAPQTLKAGKYDFAMPLPKSADGAI